MRVYRDFDDWWYWNKDGVIGALTWGLFVFAALAIAIWFVGLSEQQSKVEYMELCKKQNMTADQCEFRYKELKLKQSSDTDIVPIFYPIGR